MKKRTALAALTLTAALALVGCGAQQQNTPSTTTTTYRSTTTTQYQTALQHYLQLARTRWPGRTDAALASLGSSACDTIKAYGSVMATLIAIAEDPKWSVSQAGDAGFLFGIAVPAFCPEYTAELNRIAKS